MSKLFTNPLVSICIPTYNGSQYIEETIECAINQTYQNIEIIITDDQSTDNTLKICNSFALKDDRIKVFQNKKNLGLLGNWCEVVDQTSKESDWIKFLFQDDLMDRTTVEKMVTSAINSNVDFVLCNREYIFEKDVSKKTQKAYHQIPKTGEIFTSSKKYTPDETAFLIKNHFLHNCLGEPPCLLFKKSKYKHSDYPSEFIQLIDYVFILEKIIDDDFYFINEKLIKVRMQIKSSIKTSLIISTYNWPEALKICLLSVLNQKAPPAEIIIADDGSTLETKTIIDEIKLQTNTPIHHVWHKDEGFQLAKIRNRAIKKSKYEYIIQIDGDLVLHPSFVCDHIKSARKNHFVRGSRVRLNSKLSNQIYKTEKLYFFNIFNKNIENKFNGIRSSILKLITTKTDKSPHNMLGCNMAYWKSDAIKINGYENKLKGWGHEDEEFAARLINLGLTKLKIKNTAIVYHLYHIERKRENEDSHRKIINSVLHNNNTKAKNGIYELE